MLYIPTIRIKPLSAFSDFSSHLNEKYFYATLGIALLIHIAGFGVYALMPHDTVMQIPVKALNIKLGGGEMEAEPVSAPPPVDVQYAGITGDMPADKTAQSLLENTLSAHPLAPKDASKKVQQISKATMAKASGMRSEFIRQDTKPQATSEKGDPLGNTESDSGEEIMRRYEQVLSLWIERHKVYPAEARAKGMEGEAVIRIRINRDGQIVQYQLEKATKFDVLNDAIEDMIRSASPVPSVPSNYPAGDRFEFLIPMSFRLQ